MVNGGGLRLAQLVKPDKLKADIQDEIVDCTIKPVQGIPYSSCL